MEEMKGDWVLNVSKNPLISRWTVGRILAKESKHSCVEWFYKSGKVMVWTVPNEYFIKWREPKWQK